MLVVPGGERGVRSGEWFPIPVLADPVVEDCVNGEPSVPAELQVTPNIGVHEAERKGRVVVSTAA
jgi:hypothetical protein